MSAASDMQRALESTFDVTRQIFGEDLCDLVSPAFTDGGSGGDSVDFTPIASNVPIFIKEISGATAQTVIGGESFASSHQLEMKRDSATLGVTPEYRIRVYARDGVAERVFQKPVSTAESFSPMLVFNATLVRQGYQ